MQTTVKINLPLTFPDVRATSFQVWKIRPTQQTAVLLAVVAIGTAFVVDADAQPGDAYFYKPLDPVSGNVGQASPAAQIFRRRSMLPVTMTSFSASVVAV